MPDEQPRRPQAPNRQRPGGGPPANPPQQPGWRVTPAPDGRGPQQQSAMRGGPRNPNNQRIMLAVVVVALLAINLWVSSAALSPNRIDVPYYPNFINQVTKGNVKSVSSTQDAIEGTFKKSVAYQGSQATLYFSHAGPVVRKQPRPLQPDCRPRTSRSTPRTQPRGVSVGEHRVRVRSDDPARRALHLLHAPRRFRRRRWWPDVVRALTGEACRVG